MATIALYAGKINQMPGLIKDVKKSVMDYQSELSSLRTKSLSVNKSVCNLDDVIGTIQASSNTQEDKIASLEAFSKNSEQFISDAVRIDNGVASVVKKRKDDFYDKYSYLKPEREKSGWEKFCDGFESAVDWCKKHWKLIATIVIVILAVASLLIPGWNAFILGLACGKLILAASIGALIGAGVGGLLGGTINAIFGGSFFEGFESGAFGGAIAGIISGGMGFALSGGGKAALTLGQSLFIGGISGSGTSLISDLGDIAFKGGRISFVQMLKNMAISGTTGVIFAGIGYGITNLISTIFKNSSFFSQSRELFRFGKTSNSNYGKITSYTTPSKNGVTFGFSSNAGKSFFRVEFDVINYLHYHASSLFGSKAHVPLSPIIESTISRNISLYLSKLMNN